MNTTELVSENPELFLEKVGVDLSEITYGRNEIRCACPVHEGADNPTGFCLFLDSGLWKCFTHGCDEKIGPTPEAMVSLIFNIGLKKSKEKILSWYGITQNNIDTESVVKTYDLSKIRKYKNLENEQEKEILDISQLNSIVYDDIYFPQKGFSHETIKKFYIGKCQKPNKPMSNRAFSLVFSDDGSKIIGMTGRWLSDMVPKNVPKWKHYGVKTEKNLYNIHNIDTNNKNVIITEGPKEVWWLSQCGINNACATLGTSLSFFHIKKLIKKGISNIYLCYDNDEAGQKKQEIMLEKIRPLINIYGIGQLLPVGKDLDEIEEKDIKKIFKDYI